MRDRKRILMQRGRKPPYGTPIDTDDPICTQMAAAFMMGEGGGLNVYNALKTPITSGGAFGKLNATAWGTGRGGPAWKGNGSSNYIDIGLTQLPSALNLTGPMTILALVNASALSSSYICADANSGGSLEQFAFGINGTGKLMVRWAAGSLILSGTTAITAGVWQSVGMIRSGTTGSWTVKTWLAGLQDNSGTSATNPSAQQGAAVGKNGNQAASYFNGLIEYVFVWARALESGEILRVAMDPYSFFQWPRHFAGGSKKSIWRRSIGSRTGHRSAPVMSKGL